MEDFIANMGAILKFGVWLAITSILGSILYYFTAVTTVGLVIAAIVAAFIALKLPISPSSLTFVRPTVLSSVLFLMGIVLLISWWVVILNNPITESVRSPWLLITPFSLLSIFIAFCISVALYTKNKFLSLVLISLTLFSALSLAAAAYPLGYGFDPFLHRATVSYIIEHGTITPKPLYYIGQYALELFATKVLHLPLFPVDVYLAPFLTALLLPVAIFEYASRQERPIQRSAPAAFIPLVLLPFAAFIQTTPQALSFLFTALAIFTVPPLEKRGLEGIMAPGIFALSALFAHPLAGIPAIFFVGLVYFKESKILTVAITALASVILPLAFTIQAMIAGLPMNIGLHWASTGVGPYSLVPHLPTGFNAWGDMAYFFIENSLLIIIVIAIFTVVSRRSDARVDPTMRAFILSALAAFLNFLFLSLFFEFSFLIDYERSDFAVRTLTLVALFLLPILPYARFKGVDTEGDRYGVRFGSIFLLGAIFIANVYGAYPRHDNYARSSGFNVENADFEIVKSLEGYAHGRNYVVLSNQATSAAAVQTLGFKKYYPGDIFFYPIPTGGKLYQIFLDMNASPALEHIEKAQQLTGAEIVFYVVSDYWWDAANIIENTKTVTDHWFPIGDGSTTVFVFENF